MRKFLLIFLGITGLLGSFVLFNQFDQPKSRELLFEQEIPEAKFDNQNGFYIQWGLGQPPDVDITTPEIQATYRRLHDTTMQEIPDFKWDHSKYRETYRANFRKEYGKLRLGLKVYDARHMIREVKAASHLLANPHPNLLVLMERYRRLIDAPYYADFTKLTIDAPIPNLLAWLEAAKLYTAYNLFLALEGDWVKGTSNLLDQIDFGKRAVKGSRYLINNLIAKAITSISIQALAGLINVKECPPEVSRLIIARTPPIQYEEYGTRTSLICEYIGFKDQLENWKYISREFPPIANLTLKLLTQKQRTLNELQRELSQAIDYEMILPFQWEQEMPEISRAASGLLWWIQNPGGKILLDHHFTSTHFKAVVLKSFRLKSYYQMLRISAHVHLHYKPERPVRKILDEIPGAWTMDPCSGKPFIWDEAKQILYSIGTDRKDDNGKLQEDTWNGDFTLPVILYVNGN
jgi:hypothetical protein